MKVEFASDISILISWHGPPSLAASREVLGLFELLQAELKGVEFHPAFCSLLVEFDSRKEDPRNIKAAIEAAVKKSQPATNSGTKITIPVQYNGEDLDEVAELTGLSRREVISRHSEVEYFCAFLGFAPGFPYLLGLPKELLCPRKQSPRTRVPAGSVALAGDMCGIYPDETPGGWQLIGRTNQKLDIKPGDRVRFEPKDKLEFLEVTSPGGSSLESWLRIESGRAFVSLQNGGTPGLAHLGVSPGGAADRRAYTMANYLVGNRPGAEVLEIAAAGPVDISFVRDTWIALTGADSKPRLDQMPLTLGASLPVSAGQRLSLSPAGSGFRTYLALNTSGHPDYQRAGADFLQSYKSDFEVLRVTAGPQSQWFLGDDFFKQEYSVTGDVNRRGVRLEGAAIEYAPEFKGRELVSEGVANGAIQIPPSGQPVILFCEQRTTGGYPKIANVVAADLFKIGQLRPGQKVRFEPITLEQAWSI
jgi:KipI family sensor histidine kinase inhibitor